MFKFILSYSFPDQLRPYPPFKVKFEDVQSLECRGCGHEWELVLNLKKPPSCYSKTNGSSWVTVESPVASAKTIRCVTRAPGVKDDVAWKCGNEVGNRATVVFCFVFFSRP